MPRLKTAARTGFLCALVAAALLCAPAPAAAYVGPGAALAAIGAAIAVLAAVFVTVGGFVWYPVKRILKAMGRGRDESAPDEE